MRQIYLTGDILKAKDGKDGKSDRSELVVPRYSVFKDFFPEKNYSPVGASAIAQRMSHYYHHRGTRYGHQPEREL